MTIINIITSIEGLTKEAENMQDYLSITMSDNPAEWVERGNTLCEYMARSGKCLADAKHHLSAKRKTFIVEELTLMLKEFGYSATTQKELINSCCADVELLVNWFDRINKTCTHQLDYIRSLMSKEKEEMRLNGMRNNGF